MPKANNNQSGVALLGLVILLLAGATVFAFSVKDNSISERGAFERQVRDMRLLMEAKRLLLGSMYKENKRPGELRQFDTDGDGSGDSDAPFGHFPWRQLHADRSSHTHVASADREAIWYFVHPHFRTNSTEALAYDVSHTGYSIDGVGGYAAVLIASGEAINDAQVAGRPGSDPNDFAAYLEDLNAVDDGQFVTQKSVGVATNDLVVGIRIEELIPRAADFAARKLVDRLRKYESDPNPDCTYPAPAQFTPARAEPDASHNDLESHGPPFLIVGMPPVPEVDTAIVLPETWDGCDEGLNSSDTDSFLAQKWFRFMRYARAPGGDEGVNCTAGVDCLTVVDVGGNVLYDDVEALVIMSGYELPPKNWSGTLAPDVFFEGENVDNDAVFQRSPESSTFNDKLYIVSQSGA